jgi:hypothetical protein
MPVAVLKLSALTVKSIGMYSLEQAKPEWMSLNQTKKRTEIGSNVLVTCSFILK